LLPAADFAGFFASLPLATVFFSAIRPPVSDVTQAPTALLIPDLLSSSPCDIDSVRVLNA
jgi:hypothetical protein